MADEEGKKIPPDDKYRYNNMADTYENEVNCCGYRAPAVTAEKIDEILADDKDVTIIDVGGGTGLLGQELVKFGFELIDILDIASCMLEKARSKNIYRKFIQTDINENAISNVLNESYDVVVACGVHGPWPGAFRPDTTDELLRILKKGGFIFITVRTEYLFRKEYRGQLIPKFERLQKEGCWERVHHSQFPNYVYGVQGEIFVYRKCCDV